ncbi:MAG: hypothetical protein AB7P99_08280 [Vicinamibacterales bacterium]
MRLTSILVIGTAALALGACQPAPEPTPAPAPDAASAPTRPAAAYDPVITLNEIMVSVVDANSHKLWDAEQEPPKSDADWAELEHAAVTLAAAGNLTAVSGNGPEDKKWLAQADWQKHSESVSTAGLAAMKAVRAKDVAALRASGDQLVLTCINCHREYKLNEPAIWSDHEQVH